MDRIILPVPDQLETIYPSFFSREDIIEGMNRVVGSTGISAHDRAVLGASNPATNSIRVVIGTIEGIGNMFKEIIFDPRKGLEDTLIRMLKGSSFIDRTRVI